MTGKKRLAALQGATRPREIGAAQGSPVSPLFLNVVLDGLDREMKLKHPQLSYARYADDIVVCAKSRGKSEETIGQIRLWLRRLGMDLKDSKTTFVNLQQGTPVYLMGYGARALGLCGNDYSEAILHITIPKNAIYRLQESLTKPFERYVKGRGAEPGFDLHELAREINECIAGFYSGYRLADQEDIWNARLTAIIGAARTARFMPKANDNRIYDRLARSGVQCLQYFGCGRKEGKPEQDRKEWLQTLNLQRDWNKFGLRARFACAAIREELDYSDEAWIAYARRRWTAETQTLTDQQILTEGR
jgi:hypothetical protein